MGKVLMRNIWALMLVLLSSCAAVGPVPPVDRPSYRNLSTPITSVALFDLAKFAGSWQVISGYGNSYCGLEVAMDASAAKWAERSCAGGLTVGIATASGPGRFTVNSGANKGLEHWVMWVDQTYRTAVIGTPDGSFGMILNRDRNIPADRMKAAREILDWNGYDLSQLRPPS